MNKLIYMMLLMVGVFATSCGESEAEKLEKEELAAYKAAQYNLFEAKSSDSEYEKLMNPDGSGNYVYCKKLKEGTGKKAYFNSHVSVYYKGYLTDSTLFDSCVLADAPPFQCAVSSSYYTSSYPSVIDGWTVALQYMRGGDIYEVWIPQYLAYGSTAQTDIPAYSTLIFEIELVSVDVQAVESPDLDSD